VSNDPERYHQLFGSDLSTWDGNPLPDGWQPLEALVLVKGINDDGWVSWATLTTDSLNKMEALGMLVEQQDALLSWARKTRGLDDED
jgi:hypothetical protein